jgi:hypothetical protein
MAAAGSGFQSQFRRQFGVAGFNQKSGIGKRYSGNDTFAFVRFDDKFFGLFVFFYVHPIVGDLVLAQELFALSAVGAPVGTVNGDFWF